VWIMHGGAGGGHQGARGGKAGRGGGPGKDAAVRSTGEGLPSPAEPDRIDGSNQMMPGMLRTLLLMSLVRMTLCQMWQLEEMEPARRRLERDAAALQVR
jgi:hypothetical protein